MGVVLSPGTITNYCKLGDNSYGYSYSFVKDSFAASKGGSMTSDKKKNANVDLKDVQMGQGQGFKQTNSLLQ